MKLILVLICVAAAYGHVNVENVATVVDESENACFLPMEKGNCRGKIRRFGYDKATNQCVPFTWSGCGGNRNRFPKKKACELACRT